MKCGKFYCRNIQRVCLFQNVVLRCQSSPVNVADGDMDNEVHCGQRSDATSNRYDLTVIKIRQYYNIKFDEARFSSRSAFSP